MAAQITTELRPKGLAVGRFVKALAVADGDLVAAHAFAQGQGLRWADVAAEFKSAVSAMNSGIASGNLTPYVASDLAEALRPATVLGKLQGVRRVPFIVRMLGISAGAVAGWVGQGAPVPVQALDFDSQVALRPARVGSIVVFTTELARSSSPAAETTIAADVTAAIAMAMDQAFCDPANAGSVDSDGLVIKPASPFHGATAIPSSGATVAAIDADLRKAVQVLVDQGVPLDSAQWVLSPTTALYLASLRGTGGAASYAGMTARGGSLLGLPAIVSSAIPGPSGSPSESIVGLIAASELLLADDGEASIETASHVSLQMLDTPLSGPRALVSTWANNLVALKAQRVLNFTLRRGKGATFISGLNF